MNHHGIEVEKEIIRKSARKYLRAHGLVGYCWVPFSGGNRDRRIVIADSGIPGNGWTYDLLIRCYSAKDQRRVVNLLPGLAKRLERTLLAAKIYGAVALVPYFG